MEKVGYKISENNITFNVNKTKIGHIDYMIDNKELNISFILVEPQFRNKHYSYKMLYILATLAKERGVTYITLDDVSDRTSQYPPSRTRSNTIYEPNVSLYTNLGCLPQDNDWYSGPERVCDIDIFIGKLIDILN